MAFLVATTSLPAVYRPNNDARMTTTGTPHARANRNARTNNLTEGLTNLEIELRAYGRPC